MIGIRVVDTISAIDGRACCAARRVPVTLRGDVSVMEIRRMRKKAELREYIHAHIAMAIMVYRQLADLAGHSKEDDA